MPDEENVSTSKFGSTAGRQLVMIHDLEISSSYSKTHRFEKQDNALGKKAELENPTVKKTWIQHKPLKKTLMP